MSSHGNGVKTQGSDFLLTYSAAVVRQFMLCAEQFDLLPCCSQHLFVSFALPTACLSTDRWDQSELSSAISVCSQMHSWTSRLNISLLPQEDFTFSSREILCVSIFCRHGTRGYDCAFRLIKEVVYALPAKMYYRHPQHQDQMRHGNSSIISVFSHVLSFKLFIFTHNIFFQ